MDITPLIKVELTKRTLLICRCQGEEPLAGGGIKISGSYIAVNEKAVEGRNMLFVRDNRLFSAEDITLGTAIDATGETYWTTLSKVTRAYWKSLLDVSWYSHKMGFLFQTEPKPAETQSSHIILCGIDSCMNRATETWDNTPVCGDCFDFLDKTALFCQMDDCQNGASKIVEGEVFCDVCAAKLKQLEDIEGEGVECAITGCDKPALHMMGDIPYCQEHMIEAANDPQEVCSVNGCNKPAVIDFNGKMYCQDCLSNLDKETADWNILIQ